jgi:hypothetical protein
VIVGKIQDSNTYAFGFDAQTGKFEDLVSKGIIDVRLELVFPRSRWVADHAAALSGAPRLSPLIMRAT